MILKEEDDDNSEEDGNAYILGRGENSKLTNKTQSSSRRKYKV